MDEKLLKHITLDINGRMLYPELENAFPKFAEDLTTIIRCVLNTSKGSPLDQRIVK